VESLPAKPIDDALLVERIISAFNHSDARFKSYGSSMWGNISKLTQDLAESLRQGDFDAVTHGLRNPHTNNLFYGFDSLAKAIVGDTPRTENEVQARVVHGHLIQLAEATGTIRSVNPEQAEALRPNVDRTIQGLITGLDETLGYALTFPNPYPYEVGLPTSRGVASYRAIQACYQAWRAATLVDKSKARVLEIGAGLGRTAYFANQSGITDYTIIDIPLTNVAQAYFLGRVLSPSAVTLTGERRKAASQVNIFDSLWRPTSDERFDLVMNVDSLTEMDRATALEYLEMVRAHSDMFLSINHEGNHFTITELLSHMGMKSYRSKYWLRAGYVEEVVRLG
jgi:hypothetical protein